MSVRISQWLGALGALAMLSSVGSAFAAPGLNGEYYVVDPLGHSRPSRAQLFQCKAPTFTRTDPTVGFSWVANPPQDIDGNPPPVDGFPADGFAARWTGTLNIDAANAGSKQVIAWSDDGMRIWIKDTTAGPIDPVIEAPITDQWNDQGAANRVNPTSTFNFEAGHKYYFLTEFYEGGGDANAQVRWVDGDPDPATAQANVDAATADNVIPAELFTTDYPAGPSATDTTTPGAPTELTTSDVKSDQVTLNFKAPDDGGQAAGCYEIRYSTAPLNDTNFGLGTEVASYGLFAPAPGGTAQTFTVTGLGAINSYSIGIRAKDLAGNVGKATFVTVNTPAAVLNLPTFPTVAKADLAVYYDDVRMTNWVDRNGAIAVRDYFVGKGYAELDASALADFMTAHASSKTPSAVVMANDVFPDTVVESAGGTLDNQNTVNQYMNNNGRVIFMGDWPFYNIANDSGTALVQPGGAGAIAILGFNASGGPGDTLDSTVLTSEALALGLTSSWKGQRPALTADVDAVLATSKGGAAGWVKFYPDKNSTGGFYRLVDQAVGTPTADQMSDAQKLAEFSGTPVDQTSRINGLVKDAQSKPALSANAVLTSGGNTYSVGTDVLGAFSTLAKPGSYTVSGTAVLDSGLTGTFASAAPATVNAGQVTVVPDLVVNPLSVTFPVIAPADQAVYYDPAMSTGWFDAASATKLHDALVGENFVDLDAAGLATFMQAHVTSKTPSVVVMAQDQIPETVVTLVTNEETGAQTLDPVATNHLVRQYMDNGGRIIHIGDWPFYNVALSAGGVLNPGPGGSGATTILGIPGSTGPDTRVIVTPTPVATAMGLTATWESRRPASLTDVDVVLARSSGGADAWIKLYPNKQGTGAFIRVVDAAPVDLAPNIVTDEEVADVLKLAQFSGLIPGGGTGGGSCLGNVTDDNAVDVQDAVAILRHVVNLGDPLTGQKLTNANVNGDAGVDVQDAVIVLQAIVDIAPGNTIITKLTCGG